MLFFFAGFASDSFLGVFVLWVSFEKDEWFFFVINQILEHFGPGKFSLVNDASVILLSIIIAYGVFVVIEDATFERCYGVVFWLEVIELEIEAIFEQFENILLFMFNSDLPYGFLDGYGQSSLFHLVYF